MTDKDKKNFIYTPEHPLGREVLDFLKSKQPLTYQDLKAISDDIRLYAHSKIFNKVVEL